MVWEVLVSGACTGTECSGLTVDGEAELAEASIERIDGRFDCLDDSRVEVCGCIVLGVRRRCI